MTTCLPGYSSHQFSVSVETELVSIDDMPGESARLYSMLQSNVDGQMLQTGFVPPTTYGHEEAPGPKAVPNEPHPASRREPDDPQGPSWRCSEKQRDLILKLVDEYQLDKNQIENLAVTRFGKGVRQLNKIEASGLIDELFETHGRRENRQSGAHRERRAA